MDDILRSLAGAVLQAAGARIDWILCSRHFTPREAAIDLHREGTRWPSDHFPVTGLVAWAD